MALLGGAFFLDNPVPKPIKIVAGCVYLVFSAANFRALRLQHTLLENTYADIVALSNDQCCVNSELMNFFVSELAANFGTRMFLVAAILHLVALCIFAISLFTIASRPRDNSELQ